MQLTRKANKAKINHLIALRAGGWVVVIVVRALELQGPNSLPRDSTLTLLLCLAPHLFTVEAHVVNIILYTYFTFHSMH